MGCFGSKAAEADNKGPPVAPPGGYEPPGSTGIITLTANGTVVREKPTSDYRKPQWKTEDPNMTKERLAQLREEFWDTSPHYGGSKEIWDALKAAVEAEDMETTRLVIEAAGVVVASADMTICYDERGAKYELPPHILCDPVNVAPSLPPQTQA